MSKNSQCSKCGSLIKSQDIYCPSCGQKNHFYNEKLYNQISPQNRFLLYILVASILLPTLNILIDAFVTKYQIGGGSVFDFTIFGSIASLLFSIVYVIFIILMIVQGQKFEIKENRRDFSIFGLKVFLLSVFGSLIYNVLNNFTITPFINSIHTSVNITYVVFSLSELIFYLPISIIQTGLSFVFVSFFAILFANRIIDKRNFVLSHYIIYFVLIGFIIGFISSFLTLLYRNIILSQKDFFIRYSIYNLIGYVLLIFIPMLIIIIQNKFIHISLNRDSALFALLLFLFALIGRDLGDVLSGNSILSSNFHFSIINEAIYIIASNLQQSFVITINFFVLLFFFQLFTSQIAIEPINTNSKDSKFLVSLKNIFKKPADIPTEKVDINPSLTKIEQIIKENSDN